MRMLRMMIIFVLFFMSLVSCWAIVDITNEKTISGTIADVDKVESVISVRYINPASGGSDEINIIVPDETVITNGTKTQALCDVQQFDPVSVTYYDDGVSGLKALRISDLNQPNR